MMKTLRLVVLLLLTVLLPLRGALAATVMCAPASAGSAPHATMHADHATPHDHAAMLAAQDHGHDASHACNVCADCCAPATLPADVPAVRLPAAVRMTVAPAPAAPAPSFLSDGQERPPRGC